LATSIIPALSDGQWVIGDRHDLSSRAYQGGGREFDDQVMESIAQVTLKGFKPDLTLYLDLDPKIGLSRAQARGELDRIELEELAFFQRVRAKYQQIAAVDNSIVTIDASRSMEEVHLAIKTELYKFVSAQQVEQS